jgi:hypothetical protein
MSKGTDIMLVMIMMLWAPLVAVTVLVTMIGVAVTGRIETRRSSDEDDAGRLLKLDAFCEAEFDTGLTGKIGVDVLGDGTLLEGAAVEFVPTSNVPVQLGVRREDAKDGWPMLDGSAVARLYEDSEMLLDLMGILDNVCVGASGDEVTSAGAVLSQMDVFDVNRSRDAVPRHEVRMPELSKLGFNGGSSDM